MTDLAGKTAKAGEHAALHLATFCYLVLVFLQLVHIVWLLLGTVPSVIVFLKAGFAVPAVFLSWKMISKPNRMVISFAFGCGAVLLAWHGAEPAVWLAGVASYVNLSVLLTMLGLIAFPFRQGRYGELLIKTILQHTRSKILVYFWISTVMTLMASLILFPTIPTIYYLIADLPIEKEEKQRFLGTLLTRGYVPAIMVTPFSIVMILSLGLTGVDWIQVMPYGLLLTGLGLILPLLYQRRSLRGALDLAGIDLNSSAAMSGSSLAFTAGGLLLGLVLLNRAPHLNLISSLILATILFPLAWSLVFGQVKAWAVSVREYRRRDFPLKFNEASLFIAIGFFSEAVRISGIGQLLLKYFVGILETTGLIGIALAIPLIITLLAMIGINNFVGITFIGAILLPAKVGIDPVFLCMLYVLGGAISIVPSPFSIIAMITGNLLRTSSYWIARLNLGYTAVYLFLSSIVLTLCFS